MNMATCSAFSHTSNSEQVMGLSKTNLLSVICCFCLNLTVAIDTIRSSQSINDTEYIISNGSAFRLGFFSPANSTNRYLGIWYNNISVFTDIWVANRQKPHMGSYYIRRWYYLFTFGEKREEREGLGM